ncbi:MAG: DUF3095 domain-containing protein [Pseudanabaenaceae cyanobacterium bins.68]|nr:DUF3095 domain-containing protein [Pseudanabaenaceae cyanobacterium bins.68]
MPTSSFYADLPPLTDLIQITDRANFVPVPLDWLVLITDVVGSTQAIEAGRYKEINLIGACSIVAVLNVAQNLDIPFIFGGDGATLIVPPFLGQAAELALLATRQMAARAFDLDLRVGVVPVADLVPETELVIAKLKISDQYSQAIVRGGGVNYATALVKQPGSTYQIDGERSILAEDFSGLECRWQDVPSPRGETVSLIVVATQNQGENDLIYRRTIRQIQTIYGANYQRQPVTPGNLRLSFSAKQLEKEARVFVKKGNFWQLWRRIWWMRCHNLVGLLLMTFGFRDRLIDWSKFKSQLVESTDYQKFDDALRMVISGDSHQRQALQAYLEYELSLGNLTYGIHVSNRALVTCLVFERHGRQVHFVDGADGGYAIAAKKLKQRQVQAAT